MKILSIALLFAMFFLGLSATAVAELDRPAKPILVPSKAPNVKGGNSQISSANLKDLQLDKSKLLRCWQFGQLIVAENGWQNPTPEGKTMLTRGSERMVGYDYGETFCLYISN